MPRSLHDDLPALLAKHGLDRITPQFGHNPSRAAAELVARGCRSWLVRLQVSLAQAGGTASLPSGGRMLKPSGHFLAKSPLSLAG